MAEIRFNVWGYDFQEGVKTLQVSFDAGSEALRSGIVRAHDEAKVYALAVAADPGAWIGEHEDGLVLWDQAQVLEMGVERAEDAILALRKAFVIAIYHHWERSARNWTGLGDRNDGHLALSAKTVALGYPIHRQLEAVRDLVNILKHGNDDKGRKLKNAWQEVFSADFQPGPAGTDWYEAVRITDRQVLEVCEVVAGSGPTPDLLPGVRELET